MDEITKEEQKELELSDLSPAHQVFCLAILAYKNQTRAYMEAYPDTAYDTARVQASLLIANPNIRKVIDQELDRRAMAAREIIDRQGALARADMGDIIEMREVPYLDRHGEPMKDDDGHILYNQVPVLKPDALERYSYLIKRIHPANGGGVSVELHSVQEALSAMERIRKLITDTPPAINVDQVVIMLPDNSRDPASRPAPNRMIDVLDVEPSE